jgi:hypothetical protein
MVHLKPVKNSRKKNYIKILILTLFKKSSHKKEIFDDWEELRKIKAHFNLLFEKLKQRY